MPRRLAPGKSRSSTPRGREPAGIIRVLMHESGEDRAAIANFYNLGDFWLAKSPLVHIQGRHGTRQRTPDGMSSLLALAVGGPFLRGRTLIVEPMHGSVTWSGQPILWGLPSLFQEPGILLACFHIGQGRISRTMNHFELKQVDLELPGGNLTVDRWAKHLDVMIATSWQAAGGQVDRHCRAARGARGPLAQRRPLQGKAR